MKNKKTHNNRQWLTIIGVVSVMIVIGLGLFFYHNFFRQTHGHLVETIPSDALYILQLNDNENFVKSSTQLLPYLNDILAMDALPGFEFFMDKFPSRQGGVVISCHHNGDQKRLLLSTRVTESMFKELLKILRIDDRNFIPFDNVRIYSYGTHYKKFNFTFHNNFFSISEDVELLKKSIVQLKHPRNLLANKNFSSLYNQVILKNNKQNWLILNNKNYFEDLKHFLDDHYQSLGNHLGEMSEWSAFLIRLYDKEISLSGYTLDQTLFFRKFDRQEPVAGIPTHIIPFSSNFYIAVKTPDPERFIENIRNNCENCNENAMDYYRAIEPTASYYFNIRRDTLMYRFLALETDTGKHSMEDLLPDSLSQREEIKFQQYTIYKSKPGNFNSLLSILHQRAPMNYFLEYEGYYIFSDTTTSLQHYIQNISKSSLENQPLYKFSKTNIPTSNNFEFCFLLPEQENRRYYSSASASNTPIIKGIQVLSYSFSAPEKGFVPLNVYIKFK